MTASLFTFITYTIDKSAAGRGGWRTPESTLHALAMAGGWPGALLAQQFLRHKSAKAEFRSVFWVTVVVNVAAFVLLCSPAGRALWAGMQGLMQAVRPTQDHPRQPASTAASRQRSNH